MLWKIYKEHLKLSNKETNNPIKISQKPSETPHQKDIQMANKHGKMPNIICDQGNAH